MTPTLNTHDLMLRVLTKPFAQQLEWLNNKDLMQFSEQRHRTHSELSVRRYVNSFDGESSHLWGIYAVDSGKAVGTLSAHIDGPNNIANMGILVARQKQGYGTQAWLAVATWLLDPGGARVRKVEAGTMANNLAMRRVFDKCGFTFEGEVKNHFLWAGGQPVGKVLYCKWPTP